MQTHTLPFQTRTPTVISRMDVQTDPNMGCEPHKRPIADALQLSFINVNKPAGPTSHQVADYVKSITGAAKAGHGGTLDPGVTGVLPVALNDAAKVVRSFLLAGKEYVCYMKLHKPIAPQLLAESFDAFTGPIRQLPPLKSAVKREWRTRSVYYIACLEHDGTDVLFRVGCQAGTYIRKLCTDIGDHLGCGAHMQQLLRTQSAQFTWQQSVTLQDVADAVAYRKRGDDTFLRNILIPVERAVDHLPKMWLADSAVASVSLGAKVHAPGVVCFDDDIQDQQLLALMSLKNELVALGTAQVTANQLTAMKSGLVATLERVVMKGGVYIN